MPELIDKDYIKNMLLAWGKELSENPNAESDIQIDMIRQFYNSVSDFPTIDAEPVRHGRWIFVGEETMHDGWTYRKHKCSECDFVTVEAKNFCQNCGADMREGGADND